jgi:hypothetical protein
MAIRERVSGVGANSERTDMNISQRTTQPTRYMSGGQYGEGQEMLQMQGAAPMQGAPETTFAPSQRLSSPLTPPPGERVVSLTSETMRPDEFPESGMPFGRGVGPEAIVNTAMPRSRPSDLLLDIMQITGDGEVQALYEELQAQGL